MSVFTPIVAWKGTIVKTSPQFWIAALQTNFDLVADGIWGPKTDAAVMAFQKDQNLTIDGVAGPVTQRALCLVRSSGATTQYKIPDGLLQGIIEGESSYFIPCVQPSSGGYDIGAYQEHLRWNDQNDANVQHALTVSASADDTASSLRAQKDKYVNQAGVTKWGSRANYHAWRYAILYHNWQAAADHFAAGDIDTWVYYAKDNSGVSRPYHMSDPADWIINIGVAGVSTGYEWAGHYVNTKIQYVTNWIA
jgi:hypothetical protein